MGAAQTAPIVSNEPEFTVVDINGGALHFDHFAYELSVEDARGDYHDANWLACRITLRAGALQQSVEAWLLTDEINELSDVFRTALSGSGAEQIFTSMEPYIKLYVTRPDRQVWMTGRLDIDPALGPVLEFRFVCREADIEATLAGIARVQDAFPVR